jgi:cell division cycle 20-like protein 1 (cofactor of APC complex)
MKDHKAAVRALSWNPNATGVLATGGGSADKTIKISNTLTNTILHSIEVDSQVCKLMFSRNTNEIVSAHGYERHQIMVW